MDKMSILNIEKYTFSIPYIDNLFIPHIDKIIFVYIAYTNIIVYSTYIQYIVNIIQKH